MISLAKANPISQIVKPERYGSLDSSLESDPQSSASSFAVKCFCLVCPAHSSVVENILDAASLILCYCLSAAGPCNVLSYL